jgi:hypothetical protein
LKVSYIGNFKFPWCTEVHIAATLEDLGIKVRRLQEDELDVENLTRRASDSDILLYTRTWGVDDRSLLVSKFRELEANGTKTASYHLDLYLGIKREQTIYGDPFWSTQYVFTPDGDPVSADKFQSLGINHFYIKPAVYKAECYSGEHTSRFASDIAFVGSVQGYHDEWPYRQKLHNWLQATYNSTYAKYGHPESLVRGQDLNNLYASAKIIIGDSLCPNFNKPYYWSDRIYETLGRGGFLIHPYISGLEEEFEDGRDLVFYEFGNFQQLKQLIGTYLQDSNLRNSIASQGQSTVKNNCTYHDRLSEVLGVMGFEL